jgi:hypothetical protein
VGENSATEQAIFEPKKEEVTEEWKRVLNEGSHNLYSSPNIVSVMKDDKMDGACSRHVRDD